MGQMWTASVKPRPLFVFAYFENLVILTNPSTWTWGRQTPNPQIKALSSGYTWLKRIPLNSSSRGQSPSMQILRVKKLFSNIFVEGLVCWCETRPEIERTPVLSSALLPKTHTLLHVIRDIIRDLCTMHSLQFFILGVHVMFVLMGALSPVSVN